VFAPAVVQHPVNVTTQPEVLKALLAGAAAHRASVVPAPSQYEAQDWSLVPCCNKGYNITVPIVLT
jgi:hypothetical protein